MFVKVTMQERTSTEQCIIPTKNGSIFIPRQGVPILYSFASVHRRHDLWGDDADTFDPERWLDERAKQTAMDPFMFFPFNAGPRYVSNLGFKNVGIPNTLFC